MAVALACAGATGVHRAVAITGGQLDGNGHPAVVLVASQQGGNFFRCSGMLIAPTYVVTAGHCVGEPGEFSAIRVFTESDVDHSTPHTAPFCTQGGLTDPNCVEGVAWAAHPQFTEADFSLHDVGVIKLSRPVDLPADAYGRLPSAGQLDSLHPGSKTTFTSVGYGLQRALPSPASFLDQAARVRMVAYPQLVQVNTGFTGPDSLLLSDNQKTGGICFGDSGGPNLLGSSMTIAGVSSFVRNAACGGTAGVFRLDKQDVLNFVHAFEQAHGS